MRFTLIPIDRKVVIDGDPRRVDPHITFDPKIHAIQWYHTWGEIEYVHDHENNHKPHNERFTDLTPYKAYVEHHAECVKRDTKLAEEEEAKARAATEAAETLRLK